MRSKGALEAFVGIDAGSSVLKVIAFDINGLPIAHAKKEVEVDFSRSPVVELNIEDYWSACLACLKDVERELRDKGFRIASISVSSQGSTFVGLDKAGKPAARAIFWMDTRAAEEAKEILKEFGKDRIYLVSGQPSLNGGYVSSKLLWLARREPNFFQEATKVVFLQDYLIYRLTGIVVTDYSLASITGMLDIRRRKWWSELLDFLGVHETILPELVEPGTVVEHVRGEVASMLGVGSGVDVCTAGLDQAVSAIGAGSVSPGICVDNTGTVIALSTMVDEPRWDPSGKIPLLCYSLPGKYYFLLWSSNGGSLLKWFRDGFMRQGLGHDASCESWAAKAQETNRGNLQGHIDGEASYELMVNEAMEVVAGAEGLLMLPHLAGAGSPELNEKASGVFYGIRLKHHRAHFIRAILEATGYVLRGNIEEVEKLGYRLNEVRSLGGGSKSVGWLQIKSDICQKPFLTFEITDEAAALGSCLLAAKALGYFSSYDEAAASMIRFRQRVEPRPELSALYSRGYAKYKEIYGLLEPSFES